MKIKTPNDEPAPEVPITEAQLAERWHCSVRTVQRRRKAGLMPPYFTVGRTILYLPDSVVEHELRLVAEGAGG